MEINQEDLDKYNARLAVLNKEFGYTLASEAFIAQNGAVRSRVVVLPAKEEEHTEESSSVDSKSKNVKQDPKKSE